MRHPPMICFIVSEFFFKIFFLLHSLIDEISERMMGMITIQRISEQVLLLFARVPA